MILNNGYVVAIAEVTPDQYRILSWHRLRECAEKKRATLLRKRKDACRLRILRVENAQFTDDVDYAMTEANYATLKHQHIISIRFRVAMRSGIDLDAIFQHSNKIRTAANLDPLPYRMLNELKRALPLIINEAQMKMKPHLRADYSAVLSMKCNQPT